MYPNPQDALPLPPRPDAGQYRKLAKDLAKACRSGHDAIRPWAARWVRQLLDLQTDASLRPNDREVARLADAIAGFARERLARTGCSLTQAQFVVARAHGFASWPVFVAHVAGLSSPASEVSAFEQAADAIVRGDLPTLERLLAREPGLVRARSTHDHRATLLHYVSANGVENYRQRTPANIVNIARRLVESGAEVDAEAHVYGGGATTLGLVVTSAHPRLARVQNELADLLLDRGARMDAGIVRSCLLNGCPEAAEHMATRGAALDLEEAAGIGRLDAVVRQLDSPHPPSPAESAAAFVMAAWYDRRDVVTLLLDRGVGVGAPGPRGGQTALHVAAYHGNVALVERLIERGARVNATDALQGTTPLAWALHAWLVERHEPADSYRAVLRRLAEAGAELTPQWLGDERLRAEGELHALLSRRASTE